MLHQAVFSPLIFLCTKMEFSLLIFVHKMGPSLLTFWTKMWFLVLIFVHKNGLFPLSFVQQQRWGFSSLFFVCKNGYFALNFCAQKWVLANYLVAAFRLLLNQGFDAKH
jgi:hypothetical protein